MPSIVLGTDGADLSEGDKVLRSWSCYSWGEGPDNTQGSKRVLSGKGTCWGRNETEWHLRREGHFHVK